MNSKVQLLQLILFLSFIIIDEEDEEVHDPNMAPKVDYKNYGRIGMSKNTINMINEILYLDIICND